MIPEFIHSATVLCFSVVLRSIAEYNYSHNQVSPLVPLCPLLTWSAGLASGLGEQMNGQISNPDPPHQHHSILLDFTNRTLRAPRFPQQPT